MRAVMAAVFGIALLCGTAYVRIGGANAAGSCDATATESTVEQQLVGLINVYRGANGLQPLGISTVLSRTAHWMANDLVTNDYFAHEPDSLGRSFVTRSHDCGVGGFFGENIAYGGATPAQTLGQWQASPPHNAALLNSRFTEIGVAVDGYMWVADFGSQQNDSAAPPSGQTQTPSPTPSPTPTATPTPPPNSLCPTCSWRQRIPELGSG